jgi:copper chaperone CopZ
MKKILLLTGISLLFLSAGAQFTKGTLQATGLTCAMCSNAVNKALLKVPFVESVNSDIKNSAFSIVFKKDAEVDIDALKNAVEDAGFSVGSLKITGNFTDVHIAKNKHIGINGVQYHFLDVADQTLNGESTFTIVDKDFVTAKEFKKISSLTKMNCLQTGKASSCCVKDNVPADARVYHVRI